MEEITKSMKRELTRAETEKQVVCQIRFIPFDKTLNHSISWSRLKGQNKQKTNQLFSSTKSITSTEM